MVVFEMIILISLFILKLSFYFVIFPKNYYYAFKKFIIKYIDLGR